MTWMAWRQMRASIAVAAAALAAIAVLLLVTGLHLNHLYSAYQGCDGIDCDSKFQSFITSYPRVKLVGTLLVGVPVLLGVFWGAPLVSRELESGTFRLAWTQGVTRTRWLATRLAVGAGVSALVAGAYSFAVTWWAIPFDRFGADRINPAQFSERGIVPVAYALFGFALGVAAGVILRRLLAAIAVTIVGFVATRMVVEFLVRPRLLTPVRKIAQITAQGGIGFKGTPAGPNLVLGGTTQLHGAWVTGTQLVDAAGHTPTAAFVSRACPMLVNHLAAAPPPGVPGGKQAVQANGPQIAAFNQCIRAVSSTYHEVISYQPNSRFWELQWIESAIFLGLAVMLTAFSVYWVRRRLS
jgi:hypothetical protein